MGCNCGGLRYSRAAARRLAAAAKKVAAAKPSPVSAGEQVVAQTAQRPKKVHGYKIRRNPVK